jgi:hypothetical protein
MFGVLPRPQGGALGWENWAPSGRTRVLSSRSLVQLSGFLSSSCLDLVSPFLFFTSYILPQVKTPDAS